MIATKVFNRWASRNNEATSNIKISATEFIEFGVRNSKEGNGTTTDEVWKSYAGCDVTNIIYRGNDLERFDSRSVATSLSFQKRRKKIRIFSRHWIWFFARLLYKSPRPTYYMLTRFTCSVRTHVRVLRVYEKEKKIYIMPKFGRNYAKISSYERSQDESRKGSLRADSCLSRPALNEIKSLEKIAPTRNCLFEN